MSSLHVLYKNDKTVIQFTPNTLLADILKKGCTHYKLNDSSLYILTHNQKPVNLSLPFRLSGIPNSSRVTITENSTNRGVLDLRIAIQLPSGQRVQSNFKTTVTLWDILLHFDKENPSLNLLKKIDIETSKYYLPVMIILNKEYDRIEELQKSTLQKLMITESILIQFKHKLSDQHYDELKDLVEGYQPPVAVVSPPQPKPAVVSPPQPKPVAATTTTTTTETKPKVDGATISSPPPTTTATSPTTATATSPPPTTTATSPTIVTTTSPKQQTEKKDNEDDEKMVVDQSEDPTFFQKATQLLQQFASQSYEEFLEQQEREKAKLTRTLDTRKISPPASKPSTNIVIQPLKPEPEPEAPSDRQLTVYIPLEEDLDPSTIEFDESFTSEDFKRLVDANKRIKMERDQFDSILRTKSMRDSYFDQKTKKYIDTSIRLIFPDRRVLEMKFLTKERVQRLYDYILTLLDDPKPDFYLYIAPPKKELDLKITFKFSELFPAANIHVGLRKGSSPIKFNTKIEELFTATYGSLKREMPKAKSPITSPTTTTTTTTTPVSDTQSTTSATTTTNTSTTNEDIDMHDDAKHEEESQQKKSSNNDKNKVPKWFARGKQ